MTPKERSGKRFYQHKKYKWKSLGKGRHRWSDVSGIVKLDRIFYSPTPDTSGFLWDWTTKDKPHPGVQVILAGKKNLRIYVFDSLIRFGEFPSFESYTRWISRKEFRTRFIKTISKGEELKEVTPTTAVQPMRVALTILQPSALEA